MLHGTICVMMVIYLGIFIKSGRKVVCSFEHIRFKFYSTFNAIYRRRKFTDSGPVTVELIRPFCLPLITYGLGVLNLLATEYLMLDNLLNNKLAKILNTSHRHTTESCCMIFVFIGVYRLWKHCVCIVYGYAYEFLQDSCIY